MWRQRRPRRDGRQWRALAIGPAGHDKIAKKKNYPETQNKRDDRLFFFSNRTRLSVK